MPQWKRKVPFSGKAKKQQLQVKKAGKTRGRGGRTLLVNDQSTDDEDAQVSKLNYQPKAANSRRDLNRYVLEFHKESESELKRRKEEAKHGLQRVECDEFEIDVDIFFPPELDFPKRPIWDYSMGKQELDRSENRYFTEYIKNLEKKFDWKDLSYFELNLETWRQLWRVIEMADIVLIIVDARYPAAMFPPSLYDYVTQHLEKEMIMVLNKVDLVAAPLIVAWKNYFTNKYPKLQIIYFTSLPLYNLRGKTSNSQGLLSRRRKGKSRMAAEGAQQLLDACQALVKDEVDLSTWREKISQEMNLEYDEDEPIAVGQNIQLKEQDTSYFKKDKYLDGILTIGCIGQPNVGKSSLMNALMGRKVVSVSKTPGHTKHFQTIFLTKNVRLCDCPGLVFPSKVPKTLQILMGSFPIAQVREPYTTVKYLAERIDLVSLLKLDHPEGDSEWSAMDVCEGWAAKRCFFTARAARLDSYRAANNILRMALDGKICLSLQPINYNKTKDIWETDKEVVRVKWIQGLDEGASTAAEGRQMSEDTCTDDDSPDDDDDDSNHHLTASPRSNSASLSNSRHESQGDDDDEDDDSSSNLPLNNKFCPLALSK